MNDQFEMSGYKISTNPDFMDKQNHLTTPLKWELDKLHPLIKKGNTSIIRKLIHLIERYPKNPQLKNYLSVAYGSMGNEAKAVEVNNWILKEHPDYLFGLLNKAYQLIVDNKPEGVPDILGQNMELKSLYPHRDEFHLAEVTGFYKLTVFYYTALNDFEQAETRLEILSSVAPDHPDTEAASKHLMGERFEFGMRQLVKDADNNVNVPSVEKSLQTKERPIFNHPELEWLYQFDSNIESEKLMAILALPRETLIEDLKTILNDIVCRYEYFRGLDDRGMLKEEHCFFGLHAVYLLGELEAEEALDSLLETFKYDSDFLHFWYYDLFVETFWDPLLRMGKNQIDKLKNFVLTPNLDTYAKAEIVATLAQISFHYPERREEVIEWFKSIMIHFTQLKPDSGIIDNDQIALMISHAMDIQAVELIAEIKQLFDLRYVSEGITGSFKSVKNDIERVPGYSCKNELLNIYEQYDELNGDGNENDYNPPGKELDLFGANESPKEIIKPVIPSINIGRNDPCFCGSGKKYKKCCLNK